MKCNFCNKEFDIKTEWLKKPLAEKIKDSLEFWATFNFDARKDVGIFKGALLMLGQVFYFLLSVFLIFFAFSGFFLPALLFANKYVFLKPFLDTSKLLPDLFSIIMSLVSAIVFLSIFLFLNYLRGRNVFPS